jgi:hypothetical protein
VKVSSPVGTFPFEPERIRVSGGHLELQGRMGAWPAKVEIAPADVLAFARLAPSGLLLSVAAAALGGTTLLRRRRHG